MAAGSPSWPRATNTVAATLWWWRTSWAAGRPRSTSLSWVSLGTGWPGGQRTRKAEAPSRTGGLRASSPWGLLLRHPAHSLSRSRVPSPCPLSLAGLHASGEAQTLPPSLQCFPVPTNPLLASLFQAFGNPELHYSRPILPAPSLPVPGVHSLPSPPPLSPLANPRLQLVLPSTALLLRLVLGAPRAEDHDPQTQCWALPVSRWRCQSAQCPP